MKQVAVVNNLTNKLNECKILQDDFGFKGPDLPNRGRPHPGPAKIPRPPLIFTSGHETKFCMGHRDNKPILNFTHISLDESPEMWKKFDQIDSCMTRIQKTTFLTLEVKEIRDQQVSLPTFEICFDLLAFAFINQKGNYKEHHQICQNYKGRMPTWTELTLFPQYFTIYLEDLNITNSMMLPAAGGNLNADSMSISCPLYSLTNHHQDKKYPCITNIPYSLCLVPLNQDYTIYGQINSFDSANYKSSKIKIGNITSVCLTSNSSEIYPNQEMNQWTLKSTKHSDYLLLHDTSPLGRKHWKTMEGENVLLTITGCSEDEFACTNGTCIPDEFRCSDTLECLDYSDEENCQFIEKNHGYMTNSPPPPLKGNNRIFYYQTAIYNIGDISTSDGVAKVDLTIDFKWYDTRLTFWNPKPMLNIDCEEIWSPLIAISDDVYYGFQLDFSTYRSYCHLIEKKPDSQKSATDPYMGK